MRARLPVLLVVCAGLACGDATIHRLRVDLVDVAPTCTATELGALRSVRVDALSTRDGAECRLASVCLDLTGPAGSVEALEDRLAGAEQPVLDVETDRLERVHLLGHAQLGCGGSVQMCGASAVSELNVVEVDIGCDRIGNRCPAAVPPDCDP